MAVILQQSKIIVLSFLCIFSILIVIFSIFISSSCHIHILGGNNSGKVEYHLMDNLYSLHIEFCYSYMNSCNKLNDLRSTKCLVIIELPFLDVTITLEVIIEV
jgi:hypothetical protein